MGMAQLLAPAAALRVAEDQGYLLGEGLELEITPTNSGAALIPSLVSGKLDLYIGSLSPALLSPAAISAGVRVVLARDAVKPDCSTWGSIYGLKRSFPGGLADLRELRGKKIAITNRGSVTEFGLDILREAAGLGENEIEAKVLRQPEAMSSLAAERIDGVFSVSYSPEAHGALREKAALYAAATRVAPGLQTSFILFGAGLRTAERKTGQAFLRAYLRGSRDFVNGRTPSAFLQLAEKNGLDPEAARAVCRGSAVPGGVVKLEDIGRYAAWALRKKYIDQAVRPEEVVDSGILAEAGL